MQLKLNNGREMPAVGFGTWGGGDTEGADGKGVVGKAVAEALKAGYRHVDCAELYLNEPEIGEAMASVFNDASLGIKREDVFVTSKVWNTHHAPDQVKAAAERSLKNLKLDYLDLYLVHWPLAFTRTTENGIESMSEAGPSKGLAKISLLDTWRAMEELVDSGKVRSIGVSNYSSALIHDLMTYARIPPVCNQVEMHPLLNQNGLRHTCKHYGIVITAYCPIARNDARLVENADIKAIAAAHKKSPTQVVLRWGLQLGVSVIPKSKSPDRIADNFKLFDFKLTDEEMAKINKLHSGARLGSPLAIFNVAIFDDE